MGCCFTGQGMECCFNAPSTAVSPVRIDSHALGPVVCRPAYLRGFLCVLLLQLLHILLHGIPLLHCLLVLALCLQHQ